MAVLRLPGRLPSGRAAALLAAGALLLAGCVYLSGTVRGGRPGSEPIYYSDLGPDSIDVSRYPEGQKRNYQIYAELCSRCHTLARSINAPIASRAYWGLYVTGMRFVNRLDKNPPFTPEQTKAILDFLEYDAQARKAAHRKEFEALTEDLKRRFEPILRERIQRLQKSRQPILPRDN